LLLFSGLLNTFFQNVFTIEDTTQGIPIFPPRTDQKLETIKFDIQKVQEHPEKLKETKSLSLTNFSIDLHIMDVKLIGR
jgi:hypothetical protein